MCGLMPRAGGEEAALLRKGGGGGEAGAGFGAGREVKACGEAGCREGAEAEGGGGSPGCCSCSWTSTTCVASLPVKGFVTGMEGAGGMLDAALSVERLPISSALLNPSAGGCE